MAQGMARLEGDDPRVGLADDCEVQQSCQLRVRDGLLLDGVQEQAPVHRGVFEPHGERFISAKTGSLP